MNLKGIAAGMWLLIASTALPAGHSVNNTQTIEKLLEAEKLKNKQSSLQRRKAQAIKKTQNEVYITIDDWPSKYTQAILDTLKFYNLKATFFWIGKNITHEHKALADQLKKDGHHLWAHSYTHKSFENLTLNQAKKEIEKTDSVFQFDLAHQADLFRYPYWANMEKAPEKLFIDFLQEKGYQKPVFRDIDTKDRNSKTTYEYLKKELSKIKAGDIILIHERKRTPGQTLFLIDSVLNEKKLDSWTL